MALVESSPAVHMFYAISSDQYHSYGVEKRSNLRSEDLRDMTGQAALFDNMSQAVTNAILQCSCSKVIVGSQWVLCHITMTQNIAFAMVSDGVISRHDNLYAWKLHGSIQVDGCSITATWSFRDVVLSPGTLVD